MRGNQACFKRVLTRKRRKDSSDSPQPYAPGALKPLKTAESHKTARNSGKRRNTVKTGRSSSRVKVLKTPLFLNLI